MRTVTVSIAHVCCQTTSKNIRVERQQKENCKEEGTAKKKRQQRSLNSQHKKEEQYESCRARRGDQINQNRNFLVFQRSSEVKIEKPR